jgi:CCR4-NOT transcriptional complex subunit CAF120
MTHTPLLDMSQGTGHKQRQPSQGLTGYIDFREKEKAAARASRQGPSAAMQAEIDRRMVQNQQRQMMEVQQRQRQMMEYQQQQMTQQMAMAQSTYAPSMMGTPSVMGMTTGTPSVMGMSMHSPSMSTPSIMGMPTGPGTPQGMVGMAYSSTPNQAPQMYNQGYFPQPTMTPNTNHMPGGWGTPTPLTPQEQYFQQQQQRMSYVQQQQQPPTQAYGASFDQAQAARQQGQYRR